MDWSANTQQALKMRIALAFIGVALFSGGAEARGLAPGSIICNTEQAMQDYIRNPYNEDKTKSALHNQCSSLKMLTNVERLSCEAYICNIVIKRPGREDLKVYTLRKYQP